MHTLLNTIWQQLISMDKKEMVAAVTGLISVILAVRNNIWTWPWGIVSVVLYGIVFYNQKLFANAGLQVFYFFPISFYAWWVWLRCGPNRNDDLPITSLSNQKRLMWVGVTVVLSVVIIAAMQLPVRADKTPLWPDPNPYADGITTALSIVAQYLQARKFIENWPLWIAADVIYAFYLFPVNKLYSSTLLYVIFLGLAFMGWAEWQRLMRTDRTGWSKTLPEDETTP